MKTIKIGFVGVDVCEKLDNNFLGGVLYEKTVYDANDVETSRVTRHHDTSRGRTCPRTRQLSPASIEAPK